MLEEIKTTIDTYVAIRNWNSLTLYIFDSPTYEPIPLQETQRKLALSAY